MTSSAQVGLSLSLPVSTQVNDPYKHQWQDHTPPAAHCSAGARYLIAIYMYSSSMHHKEIRCAGNSGAAPVSIGAGAMSRAGPAAPLRAAQCGSIDPVIGALPPQ